MSDSAIAQLVFGGLTIGETTYPPKQIHGQSYLGLVGTLEKRLEDKGEIGTFRGFKIRPYSFPTARGGKRGGIRWGATREPKDRPGVVERQVIVAYVMGMDNTGADQIAAAEMQEYLSEAIRHWAEGRCAYPGVELISDITSGFFNAQDAVSSAEPDAWWMAMELVFTLRYSKS